ncbi:hypothetical protein GL263_22610 [Streptomyces durbertensis]|uniref:Uncharacterized protein n=1 Tax=Streptomyces durbertensis TaxID=2448886 RepID=A0ABR6ELY0_9ACTN|nr:hypothetical protein [Streptomyces durbertensis]MBB1246326.1 hypothetical protein [Streptomyces durbertensis]
MIPLHPQRCDRCGSENATVRLASLIEQNTGPGGSHRACTACLPHGQGQFDAPEPGRVAR